jgi:hypothetical protein
MSDNGSTAAALLLACFPLQEQMLSILAGDQVTLGTEARAMVSFFLEPTMGK